MNAPKISVALLLIVAVHTFAANNALVGLWKTIDDGTNKPRSLVRISEQNGSYNGVIEKGLDPDDSPHKVCGNCTNARKNQKVIGMAIMQNLKQNGDVFEGGEILDPDNGKIYRCKLKLLENGKKLEVRGFIGVSLFGRSQIWLRED